MTPEENKILSAVHGELFDDLVRVYPIRTICEVLREIYWSTKDPEIREKVKEAMIMGKKMDRRLSEYYNQAQRLSGDPVSADRYDEGLWKSNPYMGTKRLEQALEEANEGE
jgi:hypothetical protein